MYSLSEKFASVLSLLRQALGEGRAELETWIPWVEKMLLDPQPLALLQCTDRNTLLILKEGDGSEMHKEAFDTSLEAMSAPDVERLLARCAHRTLYLSVDASKVHCFQIHIQKKPTGSVYEWTKYRLLTESPIDPESALFDARIAVATNAQGEKGHVVEVALCRRRVIDRLVEQASRFGLLASGVGFARGDEARFDFEFRYFANGRSAASRLFWRGFLALGPVFIFLLVLFGTWGYAARSESDLRQKIESLSGRTEESMSLLARRAHVISVKNALNEDTSAVTVTELLNALSQALPKSAWLTEIRMENGKLRLIGNAADPTAAAKTLATVPGVSAARLDSVTALPGIDAKQRFEVVADIVGRGRK